MINANGCKDIIPWYLRSAFNERFENKLLDSKSLPRNDFFVLTIKHRNETTRRLIPNSKSGKRATPLSQSFSHRVKSTRWHRKFHYFMITVKHASRRAIHLNGTTCLKYVIVKLDAKMLFQFWIVFCQCLRLWVEMVTEEENLNIYIDLS